MNNKIRYRQRLKLQAALARLMKVLIHNMASKIPADRTTALLAAEVIRGLNTFVQEAGVTRADLPPPDKPEVGRVLYLLKARRKETLLRYRRGRKAGKDKGQASPCPFVAGSPPVPRPDS